MSRPRSTNNDLPIRVYFKDGRFRYLSRRGKWSTLGRLWNEEAYAKYEKLLGEDTTEAAALDGVAKAFRSSRDL